MEEAFEECQGPHRAVEPVMMMVGNNVAITTRNIVEMLIHRHAETGMSSINSTPFKIITKFKIT
jgi:hypothetical protein